MAKKTVKPAASAAPKKAAKPKAKVSSVVAIKKMCEESLKKLKAANIETQLQADLQWCIGSYNYDKNPAGLYEMGAKALAVFKSLKAKNAKSVPAKLITDLEKALKA